jgi:hypothetical protein
MALHGASYASHFAQANYYTHVGIAFAARMIIRLTSLIPEHVADVRATGRDLEAITERLARVPGFTYAQHIREVVVKARRRHVLPPPVSAAPTPSPADDRERVCKGRRDGKRGRERERIEDEYAERERRYDPERERDRERGLKSELLSPAGVAAVSASAAHTERTDMNNMPLSAPFLSPLLSPQQSVRHDFFYAEQLISEDSGCGAGGAESGGALETVRCHEYVSILAHIKALADEPVPLFNIEMWFPYPPLGELTHPLLADARI